MLLCMTLWWSFFFLFFSFMYFPIQNLYLLFIGFLVFRIFCLIVFFYVFVFKFSRLYFILYQDAEGIFLPRIFHIGQLVSCVVLQLDDDKKEKGKRRIWLSLRLSLLHKGFTLDALQEGMVRHVKCCGKMNIIFVKLSYFRPIHEFVWIIVSSLFT